MTEDHLRVLHIERTFDAPVDVVTSPEAAQASAEDVDFTALSSPTPWSPPAEPAPAVNMGGMAIRRSTHQRPNHDFPVCGQHRDTAVFGMCDHSV